MNQTEESVTEHLQAYLNSIKTNYEFVLPSVWAEKNRILTSDVSTVQGPFRYNNTPYSREIIDTMSPYHPAKVIAIMKGSQVGITEGVIVNGIAWIIANAPGNVLFLSANDELSKEMVESRLDQALKSCGVEHLIRPNTIRTRNQRTGNTSKSKEFAGGRAFFGGVNSTDKMSRQRSIKYGFFDDWSAAPIVDKEQGSLFEILQKRFSTAKNSMKQYYISTPETRPDNIERVYMMGDQRKWHVPCPHCGAYIELVWTGETKDKKKFGIYFEKSKSGKLISKSVRYICNECFGEIWEKSKYDMNLNGKWIPKAEPEREGYYSYYMNNLIAAPNMFGWTDFAHEWLSIHKDNIERKGQLKVFMNQTLGVPWQERRSEIKKNKLARNCMEYTARTVPVELAKSAKHGNGNILLITCACDLNGHIDDARLDYDIWAHTERGSIYSIDHGSIGTFKGGDPDGERLRYTYDWTKPNNVWDKFYEIITKPLIGDNGNEYRIGLVGVDTGNYTHYAYSFVDAYPHLCTGLKGDVSNKMVVATNDTRKYTAAKERSNLFILKTDLIKDELAEMINLEWKQVNIQPSGFMNFPQPELGKYSITNYFEQYENENKVIEENEEGEAVKWKWKRKHSSSANHYFDTAVYNLALRDIFAERYCKYEGYKYGDWAMFVALMQNKFVINR